MGQKIDLTGLIFGELTVIEESKKRDSHGNVYWLCQCSCGKKKEIQGRTLRIGRTVSCGHIGLQRLKEYRENSAIDLTGQVFGKLLVIERCENVIYNSGENKASRVQWLCECSCGRKTKVTADNLRRGNSQSCGFCGDNSHGNIKIEKILRDNNLSFVREYRFADCRDKLPLPFDFFVEGTYCIEYDGKQHYRENNTPWYSETLHTHDIMKNEYCLSHNIPLIRIPYTHYDKITINDLVIHNSNYFIINSKQMPTLNSGIKQEG